MRKLAEFKLHWIEEPTSADDVLGHKIISQVRQSCHHFTRLQSGTLEDHDVADTSFLMP